MHSLLLLTEAVALASQLGFQVREELLEGAGGGHCLVRGQKWLLLDLTQSPEEQLRDVLDAIESEPDWETSEISPALRAYLHHPPQPLRKAA